MKSSDFPEVQRLMARRQEIELTLLGFRRTEYRSCAVAKIIITRPAALDTLQQVMADELAENEARIAALGVELEDRLA